MRTGDKADAVDRIPERPGVTTCRGRSGEAKGEIPPNACGPRVSIRLRPGTIHLVGWLITLAAAIVLLITVFPRLVVAYFPRPQLLMGLRGEGIDFLFVALVPVLVWLAPPLVRGLARMTHRTHRLLVGRSGFYVRFPRPREVRFRDTVIRSLGPFAINLVVIAEIEYFLSTPNTTLFERSAIAFPFLLLAAVLTSLMPGAWLVDALDLRIVNPSKGEVIREAALFEGLLGPIGALALLVSFVTLAHTVGDSYEQGIILLALWAARMFPPVLAAVCVYRILIEPDVLPGLEAWSVREGIEVRSSMAEVLQSLEPKQGTAAAAKPVADPQDSSKGDD